MKTAQGWGAEFTRLTQILEGPTPLRTAAGISGLALLVGIVFDSLNIFEGVLDPPSLILKIYVGLFGLVIFLNEVKSGSSPRLEDLRAWSFKWFPFLSVMAGKGIFMLFVGCVGVTFHDKWIVCGPALACGVIGLLYLITHFAQRGKMQDAIDKSMNVNAQNMYVPLTPHDYAEGRSMYQEPYPAYDSISPYK